MFEEEGVEYVFGYPGGAVLHIYDALFKQNDVKHILARHEQVQRMLRMALPGPVESPVLPW